VRECKKYLCYTAHLCYPAHLCYTAHLCYPAHLCYTAHSSVDTDIYRKMTVNTDVRRIKNSLSYSYCDPLPYHSTRQPSRRTVASLGIFGARGE
jgi:hypothetical protein